MTAAPDGRKSRLADRGLGLADYGLGSCDALLAQHLDEVRRHYGPAGLGVIDLPSLGTGGMVAAQIRVCAVLYWASEVEQAGLLPFVEALADGIVRGTVVEPLGAAIPELTRFWRSREQRFAGPERRALFSRIFGSGAGDSPSPFPTQFQELVRALRDVGRLPTDQGTGYLEARAGVLARQLGESLSSAGTGIAGFAARELIAQIRTALRLLQQGDVIRALGSGGPWQIIVRHAPRLLGRPVRPDFHLPRAASGLRIIAWIATEAAAIQAGTLRLPRSAAVIREAEAWSVSSGVG